jgi:hypothetical protein
LLVPAGTPAYILEPKTKEWMVVEKEKAECANMKYTLCKSKGTYKDSFIA